VTKAEVLLSLTLATVDLAQAQSQPKHIFSSALCKVQCKNFLFYFILSDLICLSKCLKLGVHQSTFLSNPAKPNQSLRKKCKQLNLAFHYRDGIFKLLMSPGMIPRNQFRQQM
jgi:hypothetical protein